MTTIRNEKIFYAIEKSGLGLEIGPSYNPIAPKKLGFNIEIADHMDAESLRKKYTAWGVDGGAIEDVDYVIGQNGLFASIGEQRARFDYILASHVIEHVPDIIQFLVDCEKILKVGGTLSLVIPDKNFCFDAIKPLSTTGQILQAHLDRRQRHSPGTIFDAHSLHLTNEGQIVWPNKTPTNLKLMHTMLEAKQITDNYIAGDRYLDVHAWQFSPTSFEFIISNLIELGFISLEIASLFDTDGHEFFFSLRKINNACLTTTRSHDALTKLLLSNAPPPNAVPADATPHKESNSNEDAPYFRHEGICPICEGIVTFVSSNDWFRDNLLCSGCLSIPRERAVMQTIMKLKPNWRNLYIHESSPTDRAISRKLARECQSYTASQYDSSIVPGQIHPSRGYRSEDLGSQTFPDGSFDIVVTQDVFKHLPDPDAAIREIARTLKPGGVHIASIPLTQGWEPSITRTRNLPSGKVEHVLPPVYHGSPIDNPRSLVTTDWGYDVAAFFQKHSGMDSIILHIDDIDYGIRAEYMEIVVSRKPKN